MGGASQGSREMPFANPDSLVMSQVLGRQLHVSSPGNPVHSSVPFWLQRVCSLYVLPHLTTIINQVGRDK